ncbi:MAG: YIEGIA family protein [Thermosediminibacteraceae bacterium]|nr:YIEGIA family protein [Thermosediminibacteraceae bacterium]
MDYMAVVSVGLVMGTLGRLYLLRVDYRQYPSYPQGYIVHLALGFIAAFLGAVAVPALVAKEYTAVTFLALAAQQFREIRDMERESLKNIEETELVPRGAAYIEDIAKAFESRNYLAMLTALVASTVVEFSKKPVLGVFTGAVVILLLSLFTRRKRIRDIATVRPAEIHFQGSILCIEDIQVMNVGHPVSRKIFMEKGLAVMIEPKDDNARATLANIGQRQAIAHDVAALLGVKRDVNEVDFMPLVRIDLETGKVGLVIVPMEKDMESLIKAVRMVPVLESSRRKPLKSKAGRKASD